jgi:CheY-like chemotaxis protein
MDLRMSDIDGFEAVRRLRAEGSTASIPVIAVTASAFGDTREAAREAGCIDYLPKPVRAEALFGSLQTHLGVRFITMREPAGGDEAPGDGAPTAAVSKRLADAVAIGSVTDLEALAQELLAGPPQDAALGSRLARLVANFDFEGLRALSESLTQPEDAGRAGR